MNKDRLGSDGRRKEEIKYLKHTTSSYTVVADC